MRYRTVLFDLDGTLIDHFKTIHRCIGHTTARMGLPSPSMASVRSAVGASIENILGHFVGPAQVPEALSIYLPYWDATLLDGAKLLPGALESLGKLCSAGTQCAVLTNKRGVSIGG